MKDRWARSTVVGIGAVLIVCSSNINWGKEHWRTVLQADAKGYYAYLPALFVYHDANLGFFNAIEEQEYYNPNLFYDYRAGHNDKIIDKYFLGTAVAQSPFFLVAHTIVKATSGTADGYSKPYVVAVNLAAIAWVLFGLVMLARLLATYDIADRWIAFTLVTFIFGTNLFYYAVVAPGMSHAYSFGACCAFLSLVRASMLRPRAGSILAAGLFLGLIVLIRPVNGLILFALPILLNAPPKWSETRTFLKEHGTSCAAAAILAVCIPCLQLLYYHSATGDWLVYAYGEEGFRWSDPHMLDILFSYKKGLFLYAPLLFITLIGWPTLLRRSPVAAWSWWVFFLLLTYVLSSWWNWWYGGSFGSRVYVEFLPLFALLSALALQHLSGMRRKILIGSVLACIVLCQIQTYQMRYYQIHWEDMDRERYWDVFLRVDRIP